MDVVVLSETKKKGNGNEKKGNFIHFYSGVNKERRARAGVSIAINTKLQRYIKSYEAINERLITLDLLLWGHKIIIIGVYAPTDDANPDEKEEFYENLTFLLDKVGNNKEIIIMGDCNGRVGRQVANKIVGSHGENVVNDNGVRLIDMCYQYQLKIMNGFFQHRDVHKYTWTQPTKNLKSIIDYIIIGQNSDLRFQDVRVKRGAICGSDHFLLKGIASFRFKKVSRQREEQQQVLQNPKYKLENLNDDSTVFLYKLRLAGKMETVPTGNMEERYAYLERCIHEAANEALGQQETIRSKNEIWWTDELEELVEEKKRAYRKWLITNDLEDRKNYNRYKYWVKKEVKKYKNRYWEKRCVEIDQSLGHSKSRQAWKTLKTLRSNTRESSTIDPIGMNAWTDYYKKLLTENRLNFLEENFTIETHNNQVQLITTDEILDTLKFTKNNKAPGPGDLPIELIKYSPKIVNEMLRDIYNECLQGAEVPEEWKIAFISSIHKKGNKMKCENYRGISVTSSVGRLYGRILKRRIEEEIEDSEEQSGFRSGRSCIDNIFCLKQLAEKTIAHNRELHLIFIDLKKAYDSVPVNQIWTAMKSAGVNETYINAVKQLYKGTRSRIKIGQNISEEFLVNKGLRQGCCISPTLFKIFIDKALLNWKKKCNSMGIQIDEESHIYSLLFTDDKVVLAEDEEDANYMFRKLIEELDLWGLEINLEKTKYMVIGAGGHDLITDKGTIEHINEYKYLGVTLTADGRDTQDIQNKIRRGKNIIKQLHPAIWNDTLTTNTKKRIFSTFVESTVTYGSEVWTLAKQEKQKLNATEMMFWRRSCKKTILDRIPNQQIRDRMQVEETLAEKVEKRQLLWYGHMRRMGANRLPQKTWRWKPQQRKKKGRPRKSWSSEIKEAMRKRDLEEIDIADRKQWRLGCGKRPP